MDHQVSSELPPLSTANHQPDRLPVAGESLGANERTEIQANKAVETGPPSVPAAQPVTFQQPVAPQSAQTDNIATQNSNPVIADDADLIEKEWVIKAKEIVERTRQDPYTQNKEVEQIKADYMKKRYNKDIKLTED